MFTLANPHPDTERCQLYALSFVRGSVSRNEIRRGYATLLPELETLAARVQTHVPRGGADEASPRLRRRRDDRHP